MDILLKLEDTKRQTLQYFDLPETDLEKSYAPGKWCIKELLHHLADAETVLYDRIRRIVSEPRQVLWAFDQDAWCAHLHYREMPLAINKAIYASVRDGIIHCTRQYYLSHGEKEFVHNETGVRTLTQEIEKVAIHNASHLAQIRAALGTV